MKYVTVKLLLDTVITDYSDYFGDTATQSLLQTNLALF